MNKDLVNKLKTVVALQAQAFTTTGAKVGIVIDTLGFESGMVEYFIGTFATGTIDFTKIEQADDVGFTLNVVDITAESLIGAPAPQLAAADVTGKIGFVASQRFVRVTLTTGGTVSFVAGANILLGAAHHQKVA